MGKLPRKISTTFTSNEGFEYPKPESEIFEDVVEAINQIISYLEEQSDD